MLIILGEIILPAGFHFLHLLFPFFYQSGIGFLCRRLLLFTLWTTTACYFARTETLASCYRAFGLNIRPTNLVWVGLVMSLVLRFASHYMYAHHWGKAGGFNYELYAFRNTIGFQRAFFQFSPLILAPVFEEIVNRGFLYKAFRASYSVGVSMLIMVLWTLWTHSGYWYHSWISVLYYSAWTMLQCYLREKSSSLWDCIICHFVGNAIILFY
jgi:membrane protease YdiL (CAAX protease family)